ncbi:MAG: hypothetical protein HY369_02485 [Candidatus Aenigmarchaeota archaeon]|nr:hypothetical protein [Candidatus Aenigmarchaeota archaeon]
MECPKCGGGCLLSEEELIRILEEKAAIRAIIKGVYICRACTEKFSRLFVEDLGKRRRPAETAPSQFTSTPATAPQADPATDPAEGLQFF